MRSWRLPGLFLIVIQCALPATRASAQLAPPAFMRVRSVEPAPRARGPAPLATSAQHAEAVWRSSWFLGIGAGLLAGSMAGAGFGVATRCSGEGMSFTVPLSALVGTAGLVLTTHGAFELSRLRKQQPLPKGVAQSVVPKAVAFAAATAGLLVAAAIPHVRGCVND